MSTTSELLHHILLQREAARRRMEYFVPYVMPSYSMGEVHKIVCNRLDRVLWEVQQKLSPRVIITFPPRHGKSTLASQKLPAYAFGKYPNMEIIGASYSTDLAGKMSREVQKTISEKKYQLLFPHVKLSRNGHNIQTIEEFTIPGYNGSYKAAGVGSGITGRGADLLIIDDPIKDMKEADSQLVRENVYDWFYSTAYTRLSAGGGVVIIQTRWHTDDLAGRLLNPESEFGDAYELINFPAIAEEREYYPNSYFGLDVDAQIEPQIFREEGDALDPARIPLSKLLQIKATSPARIWAALFQQRPVAKGGNVFQEEWLQVIEPSAFPKLYDRTIISCDMTFKDTDGTDFVVFQAWGQKGGDFFLLDQVRERMDFVTTCKRLVLFARIHKKALAKLIEAKANGDAVISTLKRRLPGLIAVDPDGSKEARAHAVSPVFQSGNVFLPNVPWIRDYIQELMAFPRGANDDQVDATSQAIYYLAGSALYAWASKKLVS